MLLLNSQSHNSDNWSQDQYYCYVVKDGNSL